MFCLNDSMRYFLCPGSTDMRKGMFSLSGLIREKMNGDVRNGDVYIFINRLKNRIKLLHAETGGLVMYEKLLEEGTFANLLVVIGADFLLGRLGGLVLDCGNGLFHLRVQDRLRAVVFDRRALAE